MKRARMSLLCSALLVALTGCGDECKEPSDCTDDKGSPAEGKRWVCESNECVERDEDTPEPGPGDGGTDGGPTDGGPTDGGDTGPGDGGTPDGGGPADGGGMTVGKGGACTASMECMAGLRCEGTAGARTCQALHVAVTSAGTAVTTQVTAVRHDDTTTAPAVLSEAAAEPSRYPRWNADGSAVAFVEGTEGVGTTRLVSRALPLTAGQTTVLTDGTAAGTEDFPQLEWWPSTSLVWTKRAGASTSGLWTVPGAGGTATSLTGNGVFPSWARNGTSLAYSTRADGVLTLAAAGAQPVVVAGGTGGEQPFHNQANDWVLYAKENGSDAVLGPLYEIFTLAPTGGTIHPIANKTSEPTSGGSVDSFIANPTWAPDGTWVAYVRTYFSKPSDGSASALCGAVGASQCPGRDANVIFLQKVNPETGAADGAAVQLVTGGTLPSFSPDGRFIAYVRAKRLQIQQINPADGTAVGAVVTHALGTDVQTNRGDDNRPRWQPR
ncbi:WD40-like Beta Propeller Repeat [Stigmatella erecta]|uniref:WD40-like Beta Propeller Repeat n=2 Tax=Stigmatella erecta TaxID=83460 RepID=A0A1I0L6Q2_9BACT|nr:WD40-like Beta Propeller Repeat [Stigmatella erecta]